MSEVSKRVPKLRFPGFDGEWEEKKAADIFLSISEKNHPTLPVLSASQEKGMILRDDIGIDIKYDKKSLSGYKRVCPGQFVIHLRSFQGGFADSEIEGITSPAYTIIDFHDSEKQYFDFWKRILTSANFIKRLELVTYGIRDGRSISFSDFSRLRFVFPMNSEQTQIGQFFATLDQHITLQQQKIARLQQRKKSLLQKMFPAEGEDQPELRFSGFADEWEEKKLGELVDIITGGTPSTKVLSYWQPKEIPWMSSGEVNKGRLNETDNMISRQGFDNSSASWVKKNSVLIALAGQGKTRGTVAINNIELTTNQSIAGLICFDEIHYEFLYQNLSFRYEELRQVSSGDGTRGGLNKQIIKDITIIFPSLPEQTLIGNFFATLDQHITLHQRKLDHLKQRKQALLQQMFV